jgi:hypothetical protein
MKKIPMCTAVCLLALICFAPLSFAQSTRIDGGTVSQEKFGFYWETHLEPGTPPMSESFVTKTTDEPGTIHRILLDSSGKVYAGYDVIVTVLSEPNTYRVSFRRMAMTPEIARASIGNNSAGWTQVPRDGWTNSAPQDIRGGDVIGLRLFRNPTTGQTVVDYVTIQEPSRRFAGFNQIPERKFTYSAGASRDFKADDVQLTLQAPRLIVNGKLDESSVRQFEEISGAVVWLYVPKHGRFLLSLVPRPESGFRQAGEVRGSSLSFVRGGERFTLNTGGRIAPGEAAFNLYVLHDPAWKPSYPNADLSVFTIGSAGPGESLLRK